jgi:hypothetical protein
VQWLNFCEAGNQRLALFLLSAWKDGLDDNAGVNNDLLHRASRSAREAASMASTSIISPPRRLRILSENF